MGVEAIDGPRSPWVLLFALAFIVCGVASLVGAASVIYDFARQPAKLTIKNILQLGQGSVVELDGLAGEPMDVLVNGTLIAQGEVVVVNDKFGIRLTDIITPAERMRKIRN